jgi:hypothetical protein
LTTPEIPTVPTAPGVVVTLPSEVVERIYPYVDPKTFDRLVNYYADDTIFARIQSLERERERIVSVLDALPTLNWYVDPRTVGPVYDLVNRYDRGRYLLDNQPAISSLLDEKPTLDGLVGRASSLAALSDRAGDITYTADRRGWLDWTSARATPLQGLIDEKAVLDDVVAKKATFDWYVANQTPLSGIVGYKGALDDLVARRDSLVSHLANLANPHQVTPAQLGLGDYVTWHDTIAQIIARVNTLSTTADLLASPRSPATALDYLADYLSTGTYQGVKGVLSYKGSLDALVSRVGTLSSLSDLLAQPRSPATAFDYLVDYLSAATHDAVATIRSRLGDINWTLDRRGWLDWISDRSGTIQDLLNWKLSGEAFGRPNGAFTLQLWGSQIWDTGDYLWMKSGRYSQQIHNDYIRWLFEGNPFAEVRDWGMSFTRGDYSLIAGRFGVQIHNDFVRFLGWDGSKHVEMFQIRGGDGIASFIIGGRDKIKMEFDKLWLNAYGRSIFGDWGDWIWVGDLKNWAMNLRDNALRIVYDGAERALFYLRAEGWNKMVLRLIPPPGWNSVVWANEFWIVPPIGWDQFDDLDLLDRLTKGEIPKELAKDESGSYVSVNDTLGLLIGVVKKHEKRLRALEEVR